MATTTVPTTITPNAEWLAKHYGVERELEAILERGIRTVQGLLGLEVVAEPDSDMGDRCIVVTAVIDPPIVDDEPSFVAWWSWRIETFGVETALRFLVCRTLYTTNNGR